MHATEIGHKLAQLRRNARINQAELAMRMGVDQSTVSRLEGDPKLSLDDAKKYLVALNGDPGAKELSDYLECEWEHLAKPAFRHPHRHEIWMGEQAIAKLRTFIADPTSPNDLV